MKNIIKTLAVLLILCLALSSCGKEKLPDIAGEWKCIKMTNGDDKLSGELIKTLDSMGQSILLNVRDDKTAEIVLDNEPLKLTWDAKSFYYNEDGSKEKYSYTLNSDGTLLFDLGEEKLMFARLGETASAEPEKEKDNTDKTQDIGNVPEGLTPGEGAMADGREMFSIGNLQGLSENELDGWVIGEDTADWRIIYINPDSAEKLYDCATIQFTEGDGYKTARDLADSVEGVKDDNGEKYTENTITIKGTEYIQIVPELGYPQLIGEKDGKVVVVTYYNEVDLTDETVQDIIGSLRIVG